MKALALLLFLALPAGAAEPSAASTALIVRGEVERELRLAPDELRAIAARRGKAEQGSYSGIRLVDLLAEAGVRDDAPHALRRTYVVAIATDGYPAVFSWGELFNNPAGAGVLVATDRDGVPLRDGEGSFTLVSLTDTRTGPRHVKWLARIEVRRVPEGAERK
jgi:DMSO/TMAO reductase YedYZ molybdopterin-dependent catalytic subunit